MNLRVNREALNNFYDLSNNESEFLREKIDLWLEKIEELKEIWQGKDASEFYDNTKNYFERLKVIPEFYDTVNNFVIKANKEYKEADMESKKDFQNISKDWDDKDV